MKSIFLKSVLIISLLLQIAIYSANINYENYTRSQNNTVKKTKFAKTGSNISSERAKQIALSNARISEREAKFTKINLGVENGIAVYEIEFYVNGRKFEYYINSNTGEIIKFR